ncbi:MAG TPA: CDP-diacylglycerol--glycerol-3-phosphate 3-phosphatidyltransferase, partial [Dermatophilaceae bacterium]|nr:CDP-diacylglycerol--glycerol-3-phosphate 3-phosphatidyltransferase [Dermatophilaceae bacterium]
RHRPHCGAGMISAGDDTQVRPPQASNWNLANALTLLRVALVPVFAWFLLYDDGQQTTYRLLAAAVFVVATATDRLDGEIARSRGEVTDFGKVSDPIADKALMGMALIGLSILDLLPWWVTVVVLIRELGVTALRFVVIRHGVISASRGGKLKTALQAVAILLYILPLSSFWHVLAVVIMTLAVIVTMVTGIDYLLKAHTLRTTSPRAQLKRERRAAAAFEGAAREAGTGTDTTKPSAAGPDAVGPDAAKPNAARPDAEEQPGAAPGASARDQSSPSARSGPGPGAGV